MQAPREKPLCRLQKLMHDPALREISSARKSPLGQKPTRAGKETVPFAERSLTWCLPLLSMQPQLLAPLWLGHVGVMISELQTVAPPPLGRKLLPLTLRLVTGFE
jgi:hypothetical protein